MSWFDQDDNPLLSSLRSDGPLPANMMSSDSNVIPTAFDQDDNPLLKSLHDDLLLANLMSSDSPMAFDQDDNPLLESLRNDGSLRANLMSSDSNVIPMALDQDDNPLLNSLLDEFPQLNFTERDSENEMGLTYSLASQSPTVDGPSPAPHVSLIPTVETGESFDDAAYQEPEPRAYEEESEDEEDLSDQPSPWTEIGRLNDI